jgi:hypothetical protein
MSVASVRSKLGSADTISSPISSAACKWSSAPCVPKAVRIAQSHEQRMACPHDRPSRCIYHTGRVLSPSTAPVVAATPTEQEHQHDDQNDEIHELSSV